MTDQKNSSNAKILDIIWRLIALSICCVYPLTSDWQSFFEAWVYWVTLIVWYASLFSIKNNVKIPRDDILLVVAILWLDTICFAPLIGRDMIYSVLFFLFTTISAYAVPIKYANWWTWYIPGVILMVGFFLMITSPK